jgi:mono/diheme cytochrome c family protein
MRPLSLALIILLAAGCASKPAAELPVRDTDRGQALYQSACSACHTEQAHWREKRLVRDWQGLLHQVTRWQQLVGRNWSPDEVKEVTEYLNQRYYHFP